MSERTNRIMDLAKNLNKQVLDEVSKVIHIKRLKIGCFGSFYIIVILQKLSRSCRLVPIRDAWCFIL